jgi:drug/metabolite transporter (DMT)-like permease
MLSQPRTGRGGTRRAAAGILYVLASAVCFGSMPIFARAAFGAGVDVTTLLLLRFTAGAACMWGVFFARGLRLPRGKGLAMLAAMGVGYAGLVAILARVVFRQRLSGLQVAAVGIALAGSALTIGRAGDGQPLGIFLGILAAVVYSAYILTGSRIPAHITPSAATAVITTTAAATFAGMAAVRGVRLPGTLPGWSAVLAVAVVGGVLAILFFFEGIERVGPVRASVYSTVEPMVTLALAAALLGEQVTLLRAGGGVLILAAVVLLAREELRSKAAGAASPSALRRPSPAAPPPTAGG